MRELEDDVIRGLAADRKNINLTLHALERLRERKIGFSDVQNVLLHGEIIEQYPSDYPFPSCLKLGTSVLGVALHVCFGVGDNKIWVITAYYPTADDWEEDMKTRKADE